MTRDPREGRDTEGYIATGADSDRIPPGYRRVLDDCTRTITDSLGESLHGLYLYGSVANGQATMPHSDLDLYAVVRTPAAQTLCGTIASQLSEAHRGSVREVGIARYTLDQVLAGGDGGLAERCFLKHYCLCVSGIDLRPEFPRCRPTGAIVREFSGSLEGARPRAMLRAAAVLFSFLDGGWSTAVETGAALIGVRRPEYADMARALLSGTQVDAESRNALRDWLMQELHAL